MCQLALKLIGLLTMWKVQDGFDVNLREAVTEITEAIYNSPLLEQFLDSMRDEIVRRAWVIALSRKVYSTDKLYSLRSQASPPWEIFETSKALGLYRPSKSLTHDNFHPGGSADSVGANGEVLASSCESPQTVSIPTERGLTESMHNKQGNIIENPGHFGFLNQTMRNPQIAQRVVNRPPASKLPDSGKNDEEMPMEGVVARATRLARPGHFVGVNSGEGMKGAKGLGASRFANDITSDPLSPKTSHNEQDASARVMVNRRNPGLTGSRYATGPLALEHSGNFIGAK